jgi:hypothetical protein
MWKQAKMARENSHRRLTDFIESVTLADTLDTIKRAADDGDFSCTFNIKTIFNSLSVQLTNLHSHKDGIGYTTWKLSELLVQEGFEIKRSCWRHIIFVSWK